MSTRPGLWIFLLLCLGALCIVSRAGDTAPADIDWARARELYQRSERGDKLSPDDQAYLDKAKAIRQKAREEAANLDTARVRELFQRVKNGEKLSPEDQAYLDKAKSLQSGPTTRPGIDKARVMDLYKRQQQGEKLSPEDQAYLDKAKAMRAASEKAGVDTARARELFRRQRQGEKLSPEDQAYLDKAMKMREAMQKAGGADIDWERVKSLYQREQAGEKLSADDQAYLDKAKAVRQRAMQGDGGGIDRQRIRELSERAKRGEKLSDADRAYLDRIRNGDTPGTAKTSLELVPLTDLAKGQKYKDQDGGLYGNGENSPPPEQLKLAQAAAAAIRPLDAGGSPAEGGKIVLLSIGMSNTTMEFSRFMELANHDPRKSADVVLVDGAQGGKDAVAWAEAPSNEAVWKAADERLTAAGVSPKQVQVLWIKQAIARPEPLGEFPKHAQKLKEDLESILKLAHERYPNVKLAYLSSRIYAGYASTALNPEPYAYEGAFAVRWVIGDQMAKDTLINADPVRGAVASPVVLWGPYLWANGSQGRQTDSLTYTRENFASDGTHPSASGRQKVAELLLEFFTTDPTAKAWFVKK